MAKKEREIKTTLTLDGEKAYKDSLKSINTQLKVASSEMGAVTSSYDKNNASAKDLAAKQEVLNKQIELQKEKQAVLKAAIDDATRALEAAKAKAKEMADAYGEDSSQAQKAADAVRKAEGNLASYEIQANNTTKTLNGLGEEVEEAGEKAEKSGGGWDKLKGIVGGVATAAATAVAAAAAGIAAVTKSAIEGYADYEQLVGGVDTLFKESSQKVQEYAASAYKTAGLSANDYMETVTGFSASLIQSLGGDTQKAAEYANMAIVDMSDNANKMGTDMSSIQNAYQGFAKQNYTMLDNLKLGYGGTKEEMARLLEDATKLSGVEYDISSYADIVSAIHVVQTEMGITGTTAKEASETISGSLTSAKTAWSNLLTGLADENADIEKLVGNFTDSVKTAAERLIPVVKTALKGIGQLISDMLPIIVEEIPKIINDVLPDLVNSAVNLVATIGKSVLENVDMLLSSVFELFGKIGGYFSENSDEIITALISAIVEIITKVIQEISAAIPQIAAIIPEIVAQIIAQLAAAIPELIEAGTSLISALADGIPDAITAITAALPDIITAILDAIVEAIPELINCGAELLTSLCDSIPIAIDAIVAVLPDIITSIIDTLVENTPAIIEAGVKLFISLVENLPDAIINIVAAIPQIHKAIVEALMKTDWGEVGAQLIEGIADGFADGMWAVTEKIKNVGNGLVEGFKTFFDIHSPSKKMKKLIGYPIGQGIIDGASESVEKTWDKVEKSIESATEKITESTTKSLETMDKSLSETADKDAKSRLDATVKEAETRLAAVKKTLETELADYQKSMEQIQNNISTLTGSMTGKYTDIFTFKKDDDGNIISASTSNKIKQGMKDLDEYTELLDKLRARGMSEDMISQFAGMTVEEGLAVAKYYDGLSDKELSALQTNWEKYNEKATELSTSIYKSKIEDATKSCVVGIQEIFQSEDWSKLGKNLVGGIGSGMASKMGELSKTMTDICTGITKQFTDYFGIHSPSRLFADIVGKNLAAGIGVGFDDEMDDVAKSMTDAVPTDFNAKVNYSGSTAFGGTSGGVVFNQYNTSPKALSRQEIKNNTRQQVQLAAAVLK